MVNIKNSIVGLSAHGTLAAKIGYQRQLFSPVSAPSVSKVTSGTAKLAVALLYPVSASLKRFSAMTASTFNLSILSHNITISAVVMLSLYPEYCAIAERRIAQQVLELEAA